MGGFASPKIVNELTKMGYNPQPVGGKPPDEEPSAEEQADIDAANRILGVDVLDDGKTRLQHEIDKNLGGVATRSGLQKLVSQDSIF